LLYDLRKMKNILTSFALSCALVGQLGCLDEASDAGAELDGDKSIDDVDDVRPPFDFALLSRAFAYAAPADADGNKQTLRGATLTQVEQTFEAYKGSDGDDDTFSLADWRAAGEGSGGGTHYNEEPVRILRDMFEAPSAVFSDMGGVRLRETQYDWGNTDEVDDLFATVGGQLAATLQAASDADVDALYEFWYVPSNRPFHLAFLAEVAFVVTETKAYLYYDSTGGRLIPRPSGGGSPVGMGDGNHRMAAANTRAERIAAMSAYYDALMAGGVQAFTQALSALPVKNVTTMNLVLQLPELGPNLLVRIVRP